jgi:uncharacterized protein (DUF2267 family)
MERACFLHLRTGVDDRIFVREVAARLGVDERRAEEIVFAVFQELRDRLTEKEAHDVASQLRAPLRRLWLQREWPGRPVERIHATEFLARVRYWAALADDAAAERAVFAVFAELQKALGSPTGKEGEAWDVLSELPKDLKRLWLAAPTARAVPRAPPARPAPGE